MERIFSFVTFTYENSKRLANKNDSGKNFRSGPNRFVLDSLEWTDYSV